MGRAPSSDDDGGDERKRREEIKVINSQVLVKSNRDLSNRANRDHIG